MSIVISAVATIRGMEGGGSNNEKIGPISSDLFCWA